MYQHFIQMKKRFEKLKKIPKTVLKIAFLSLLVLSLASAILAVLDMSFPGFFRDMSLQIKSLFIYGFYVWAVLIVGGLILDYCFQ